MMSKSLLALIVLSISSTLVSPQEPVCIWGRQGSNSAINGEYHYSGQHDGAKYYSKTIDGTCGETTYLYYDDFYTKWIISFALGSSSYAAVCNASTNANVSCSSDWHIAHEDFDSAVYVQDGRCPESSCSVINVEGNACSGNYDLIGSNQYKAESSDEWIYFVPWLFQWICNGALEPNQCPYSSYAVSNEGWEDFSESGSISKGPLGTINCLGMNCI